MKSSWTLPTMPRDRGLRRVFDTAQLDLATWLVEGRGGERDLEAGFGWMKRAAPV